MRTKIFVILAFFQRAFAYSTWNCPYAPVCASDGNTYNSDCEFKIAKVENQDLLIILNAPCPRLTALEMMNMVIPKPYPPILQLKGLAYPAPTPKRKYRTNKVRKYSIPRLNRRMLDRLTADTKSTTAGTPLRRDSNMVLTTPTLEN